MVHLDILTTTRFAGMVRHDDMAWIRGHDFVLDLGIQLAKYPSAVASAKNAFFQPSNSFFKVGTVARPARAAMS